MFPVLYDDSFREVGTRRDLGVCVTVMSHPDWTAVSLQPAPNIHQEHRHELQASLGTYILFAGKEFTVFWTSESWTHNPTLTQALGIPEYQNPN